MTGLRNVAGSGDDIAPRLDAHPSIDLDAGAAKRELRQAPDILDGATPCSAAWRR